jgi:enamine deaminase RidA (YjgF/YER057c/UK114 family)
MSARRAVSSANPFEPVVGYSRAVRVGQHVWVAGTTAAAPDGGSPVGGDDAYAQTVEALRRVLAALAQVGANPADVVRTRMYVTDIDRWVEVGRAHGEVFGTVRPASTMVEVSRLIQPGLLVEVEAEAWVDSPPSAAG